MSGRVAGGLELRTGLYIWCGEESISSPSVLVDTVDDERVIVELGDSDGHKVEASLVVPHAPVDFDSEHVILLHREVSVEVAVLVGLQASRSDIDGAWSAVWHSWGHVELERDLPNRFFSVVLLKHDCEGVSGRWVANLALRYTSFWSIDTHLLIACARVVAEAKVGNLGLAPLLSRLVEIADRALAGFLSGHLILTALLVSYAVTLADGSVISVFARVLVSARVVTFT